MNKTTGRVTRYSEHSFNAARKIAKREQNVFNFVKNCIRIQLIYLVIKVHEKAKQQKAKCAEVEALTNLSNQNNISTLDQLKDSLSKNICKSEVFDVFQDSATKQISVAENPKNPCDYNCNPALNSSGIHS